MFWFFFYNMGFCTKQMLITKFKQKYPNYSFENAKKILYCVMLAEGNVWQFIKGVDLRILYCVQLD